MNTWVHKVNNLYKAIDISFILCYNKDTKFRKG